MVASTTPTRFIGCDVGKASIVVFDSRDGRTRTIANRHDALVALAAELDPSCLLVCEATGGHETLVLAAALAAGCPAHRADARKVKAFIRSFGILGKTDAIDARALASYGQERHARLARWQARDPQREQLQTLVLTRRDLVAQRVAFANRLGAPAAKPVKPYLTTLIDCLNRQIRAIEAELETLIGASDSLRQAAKTLRSIAGVGPATAAALLALMPELGTLNRRQAAALAGLAPHPNQSGGRDAYRCTKGGRPEVKRALFMAAMAAAKHNQTLAAVYNRLLEAGKKPLVALTALMRKIVVIANTKLRQTKIAQHETALQLS
jgi:transposase